MAREMIFLVEKTEKSDIYKAMNLNFNIRVLAESYDDIKKNVQDEVMKLDYMIRPDIIRYRFVREEVTKLWNEIHRLCERCFFIYKYIAKNIKKRYNKKDLNVRQYKRLKKLYQKTCIFGVLI